MQRSVLIAGASGLIGRELLECFRNDPMCSQVHALVRKSMSIKHVTLHEHVVDLMQPLSSQVAQVAVDDVYIALGTTIKVAGSKDAFQAIDLTAVCHVAQRALDLGAKRIAVVSTMGADPSSWVFYNRVKGQMENAIHAMPWERCLIVRPSLLTGNRASLNQPERPGERWGQTLMNTLAPVIPRHLQAISATTVAQAMHHGLAHLPDGFHTILSGDLASLAAG